MIHFKILIIQLFALILLGCKSANNDDSDDMSLLDINNDGVIDVFYEYQSDNSYYELIDGNFDGQVDQSHYYDNQDQILSSKLDDDFDGVLETTVAYRYSFVSGVLVDRNQDAKVDIIFYYEDSVLVKADKYYEFSRISETPEVGVVRYQFGYPIGDEKRSKTVMSAEEFHQKAMRLYPSIVNRMN